MGICIEWALACPPVLTAREVQGVFLTHSSNSSLLTHYRGFHGPENRRIRVRMVVIDIIVALVAIDFVSASAHEWEEW